MIGRNKMCQGTNYVFHQEALEAIDEARKKLIRARSQLGCDHPAYGLLGHMVDHSYEAEGRFACAADY
jgi:hypothetical protein